MPNGVEVEKFKYSKENRNKIRNDLKITESDYVIGHVGSLDSNKNQIYIIELLSYLIKVENSKNWYVILVGDGPNRAQIEKYIEKNQLEQNVLLLGKRNDVNEILSAFDIMIMPSYAEGLPVTLIEAQAADLKCYISDTITKEVNLTGEIEFFNLERSKGSLIEKIKKHFENQRDREKNTSITLLKKASII